MRTSPVVRKIPILNSLLYFNKETHWRAIRKFFVLWLLSSLPLLISVLVIEVPSGNADINQLFFKELTSRINLVEVFIYSSTFISPLLYLCVEKYVTSAGGPKEERFSQSFEKVFEGYPFVWIVAIIVMIVSLVAFALSKGNVVDQRITFLSFYGTKLSAAFYVYALYCWYLTLCDSCLVPRDFLDYTRNDEAELGNDFNKRMDGKGVL